ncbi:DUF2637 domain-containing protein [Solwaraspora sp. WMMD937]|uniref:DUF2637 domain-containing protein n=1 Tax=Solwaraspora sp. WMMD937 TaxID=3016090 RepID=UPI00249CA4AA|nr:DUF2637 domain-containing protein [Solwaraspora sp. WMMD937]WFE21620.1 DUF2637 domain-containing protein [Solwaraspora sp. WMMD937]
MTPTTGGPTRAERAEGVVLVLILLVVGGLAGAASFTHVHDWTMDNSPPGTGEWFGWANAAISELIPLAALLTIRRRRRTGGPVGYPMFLLVCAVCLSLAAQLAVAKPGISGWLLSAVPALAFLGLSKLVLSTKPATPGPAGVDQPDNQRPAAAVVEPGNPSAAAVDQVDTDHAAPVVPVPAARPVDQVAGVDQAPMAEPVRPVVPGVRRGVVPVPVAGFPTRNGSAMAGVEADQ